MSGQSPASTTHAENALRRGRGIRAEALDPEAMQATPTWQIAALAADLIQLAVAGFLLDFLLFDGTNVGPLPRVIALAGLLLTTLRSLGWPVLMAVQLSFLIREPSHRDMLHGMYSLIVTLATIGMVAYASSFKTTRHQFRNLVAALAHAAVHGDGVKLTSLLWTPQHRALAIRVAILVAVVLASMLVFVELPIAAAVRYRWWQKSLANGLVLWPGPGVVIVALALIVALWHIEWRPASPAQARLYLRSVFLRSHYRDLKMIVMRRLKAARNAQSESS